MAYIVDHAHADRPRLLLVEGPDDAAFFEALLFQTDASDQEVGILPIGGKDALKTNLNLLIKSRPFTTGVIKRVAVVRDSDASPETTLAQVNSVFASFGWPTFEAEGFKAGPAVDVGLFLVPAFDIDGDLERLCLGTKADDGRVVRSIAFQQEMDQDFGPLDRRYKRQAAIFLACVVEETRGVGNAFRQGVFDRTHVTLEPVKGFINGLLAA